MTAPRIAPFGSWPSPITGDLIAADSISFYEVLLDGDDVYWVEGRPPESGRYVVVGRSPDGRVGDVTPAPYYARTLAHSVLVFRTALTF